MQKVLLIFLVIFFSVGDGNAFVCQNAGIFANTDTNNCQSYIICRTDLQPEVHYCGDDLFFWPDQKICISEYNCAQNLMPDDYNINPCDGFGFGYGDTVKDILSIDCSTYTHCYGSSVPLDRNDIYGQGAVVQTKYARRYSCPSGTIIIPGRGCTDTEFYECSDYQCAAEGVFENPNVNDCSSYVSCRRYTADGSGTGSYLHSVVVKCPDNTKFSPFMEKCDEFYNCDGIDPHQGTDPCLNIEFKETIANVANPLDNECATYLQCSARSYSDTIQAITSAECPPNTYFSPVLNKCYYNHNCNELCSKDPCSNGEGKFVDYKSGTCETFIECRNDADNSGEYRPNYERRYCPPGTLFSPEMVDCDRDYLCPKFPTNYCYEAVPPQATLPPRQTT